LKKEKLKSQLIQNTGLPKAAFNGYAQINLTGNEEADIDGCKGIIEYSSEKITLNLGNCCASFCGDSLGMQNFDDERTVISGKFLSIEFSQGG
jgi:sporulation protein YqfC